MLRSELYDIGDLVNAAIEMVEQDKAGQLPELTSVKKLCARIQSNWTSRMFSAARDHVISRYVRFHQAGITALSDQVSMEVASRAGVRKPSFFPGLLAELEKLLQFLQIKCYRYFDIDYKVSGYFYRQESLIITSLINEIAGITAAGPDPGLLQLVCGEFRSAIDEGLQPGTSYRRLAAMRGTLSLVLLELGKPGTISVRELVVILFRRNFNCYAFVNWLKKRYGTALPGTELLAEVEMFRDIYVNREVRFEYGLPSIDDQLLPWLSKELFQPSQEVTQESIPVTADQMGLALSVPQFAMFIRVFQKNGCFPEQNAASIMRFFTRHFRTKKRENVSINSFNHAFYSKDQLTAAIVLDYLQRMTAYVNKIYFPK